MGIENNTKLIGWLGNFIPITKIKVSVEHLFSSLLLYLKQNKLHKIKLPLWMLIVTFPEFPKMMGCDRRYPEPLF